MAVVPHQPADGLQLPAITRRVKQTFALRYNRRGGRTGYVVETAAETADSGRNMRTGQREGQARRRHGGPERGCSPCLYLLFFALPLFNKRQIFFRIPIFPNSSKYKSNIIIRLGIPYIINPTKIVIVVDI
jgi:hypothetical protein